MGIVFLIRVSHSALQNNVPDQWWSLLCVEMLFYKLWDFLEFDNCFTIVLRCFVSLWGLYVQLATSWSFRRIILFDCLFTLEYLYLSVLVLWGSRFYFFFVFQIEYFLSFVRILLVLSFLWIGLLFAGVTHITWRAVGLNSWIFRFHSFALVLLCSSIFQFSFASSHKLLARFQTWDWKLPLLISGDLYVLDNFRPVLFLFFVCCFSFIFWLMDE